MIILMIRPCLNGKEYFADVERDGSISVIQVRGANKGFNKAVILAEKQIKGNRVPAKQKCNVVRTIMKILIDINFH